MDEPEIQGTEDSYTSEYEVGQDNIEAFGLDIHNPVFILSGSVTVIFVILTLLFPQAAADNFGSLRIWLTTTLDWFFIYSMNFFLLFCLALALSPLGSIRIGGPDAEARYSLPSWIAMLFAAGIGIGIMFYGVLEPMNHALRLPFDLQGLGIEETQSIAMAATLYHWAFHPWAVYAVVGLSLSFFCYNKSLPLLMRSAL